MPIPFLIDDGSRPASFLVPSIGRARRCQALAACQVCGEQINAPDEPWIVSHSEPNDPDEATLDIIDGSALHERCLRLAVRVCPGFTKPNDYHVWALTCPCPASGSVKRESARYVASVNEVRDGKVARRALSSAGA